MLFWTAVTIRVSVASLICTRPTDWAPVGRLGDYNLGVKRIKRTAWQQRSRRPSTYAMVGWPNNSCRCFNSYHILCKTPTCSTFKWSVVIYTNGWMLM